MFTDWLFIFHLGFSYTDICVGLRFIWNEPAADSMLIEKGHYTAIQIMDMETEL